MARAFRWKRMLEAGEFTTIAELAQREGIIPSNIPLVLRLTLLAPEIVETIPAGRQDSGHHRVLEGWLPLVALAQQASIGI